MMKHNRLGQFCVAVFVLAIVSAQLPVFANGHQGGGPRGGGGEGGHHKGGGPRGGGGEGGHQGGGFQN